MEKHNTDDLFKKMLEHPPPMKPDMAALEDMNKRLDEAAAKKNRKGVFYWLFPLLLLPFLFGTGFFYLKYQNAQQTINELNLQLTEKTENQTNTLKEKIVIQEYDTVFNTIYQDVIVKRIKEETIEYAANNSPSFNPSYLPNFGNNYFSSVITDEFNIFVKISSQPSQSDLVRNGKAVSLSTMAAMLVESEELIGLSNTDPTALSATNLTIAENIQSLSFLDNRFKKEHPLPLSDHFFALSVKRDDNINPLWYFVPTGFQAGMNWSPIGIANLPGSDNKIKAIGVIGEIEFTSNTRLQFGLDYLSAPFKLEDTEELNQFPMISPNDPSDILSEVYGDFKYLQVPITLKYVFNSNKRWKPSIGVGMIARLPIKAQLKYEFVSSQIGEYSLPQTLNKGTFSTKNWRASIGMEYRVYKNIAIQGEGFYNHEFGEAINPYFRLRYYGMNMGLKYKF